MAIFSRIRQAPIITTWTLLPEDSPSVVAVVTVIKELNFIGFAEFVNTSPPVNSAALVKKIHV